LEANKSESKPMKKAASIRHYIQSEPPPVRAMLRQMHAILKKALPQAGEKLAWGMPTLTWEGNLLHFAAFKHHMSLFPGSKAVAHFQPQLKKYSTSKGGIQFPYGTELPAGLITRIAKFCVKEKLAKLKTRAKKKKKTRPSKKAQA
jgi:uncharacterized protein YdhG (YjbR/CyaY superfamily)